jgi:hypothetical protein
MTDKIAGKLMQLPARQVHTVRADGGVQCRKLKTEPLRVRRSDARSVAGSKKSIKAFVPKRSDHESDCIA